MEVRAFHGKFMPTYQLVGRHLECAAIGMSKAAAGTGSQRAVAAAVLAPSFPRSLRSALHFVLPYTLQARIPPINSFFFKIK